MTPLQPICAQDSLLWKDYDYLKTSDPWLTSQNAAGLTRLKTSHLSDATISYSISNGGFVNYDQAGKSRTIDAGIESFYRLNKRSVIYGRLSYNNFAGKDMTGSAFVNPYRMPFDIVEDSLTNPGRKQRDTYNLIGAFGVDIYKGIALGIKIDYTAANYAKYKDLRHKNNMLDLILTPGIYIPIKDIAHLGINYYYRRNTESITFKTYGNADRVYKSLVNYAAFIGKVEAFGEYGYTDANREMPYFNEYTGIGMQAALNITSHITWYNDFTFAKRHGYYGKKSSYTISYNQHNSKEYTYNGQLAYKASRNRHELGWGLEVENLKDYNNSYRSMTDPNTTATYYEYYTPVKLSNKIWGDGYIAYTGYYGTQDMYSTWKLNAGLNFMYRKQTGYEYPYNRTQEIRSTEFFARGERNIPLKPGILTAALGMSYKKGSGEIYKDGVMATPSDKQVAPAEMTAFLHREYQWLTAPQYAIDAMAKYAFIFPKTRMKTYAKAGICYRRTSESDEYLEGKSHTTLSFAIGCTF